MAAERVVWYLWADSLVLAIKIILASQMTTWSCVYQITRATHSYKVENHLPLVASDGKIKIKLHRDAVRRSLDVSACFLVYTWPSGNLTGQNYLGWRDQGIGPEIPDHPFCGYVVNESGGMGTRLDTVQLSGNIGKEVETHSTPVSSTFSQGVYTAEHTHRPSDCTSTQAE